METVECQAFDVIYNKPPDYQFRPTEMVVAFMLGSKLLNKGTPSIYELKATERFTSKKELRWFDIGQASDGEKSHKVLILMGATGSGKSTLVNGMVNYILGVEWNDPFRFRIVKDKIATNQASSQTTGVTAYTIHHVPGMKVDYGVTIIDTPGYGDTGGVERDREITRIIGRFLTHPQTQSDLNSIHAVCFVASSPDSRLTPTQQHILESVVSLFGRDVTNSLRLLVTFSDGMTPPVLEAIKAAKIPGLSDAKDGRIQHQKFNNSALYAPNAQDGGDAVLFDSGYWKLGKANFESFFSMLAEMPAQSLQQTLAVIQTRTNLEHSLEAIDEQLSISVQKIGDILQFRKEVAQLGTKLEANKDFEVTHVEYLREQVRCGKFEKAFNCPHCKATCAGLHWIGAIKKQFGYLKCTNVSCWCPNNHHELQKFRWVERKIVTKQTLHDMKRKYEMSLGCQMSIQDMLNKREEKLESIKQKGVALLKNMGECLKSLESSALSSKKSTIADHVSVMKMRAQQEKRTGWATRNKILDELLEMASKGSRQLGYNNNEYGRAGGSGVATRSSAASKPVWKN